jgi:hypothetical protein
VAGRAALTAGRSLHSRYESSRQTAGANLAQLLRELNHGRLELVAGGIEDSQVLGAFSNPYAQAGKGL